MKTKSLLVTMLGLLTGLASCNKDEMVDESGRVVSGKDTYMQITISQSRTPGTYATTDLNASEEESDFSTVDLYVYDLTANVLEVHKRINKDKFTGAAAGNNADEWKYTSDTKIPCKTGNKKVLAALNISQARGIAIANKGMNLFVDSQFGVTNYGASDDALVDFDSPEPRGIAMFSVGEITATMYPESDATNYALYNKVTIPVQRLVAKVTLQELDGMVVEAGGGKVFNLEYALATTNLKTYLLRPWGAAGSGAVKDHNWIGGSYVSTDFFASPASVLTDADYVTLNAKDVPVKELVARYCPENTSEDFFQKEVTAAVVRCKYVPGEVIEFTNGLDNTGGYTTITSPNYDEGIVATFYTVSLAGGVKQYFLKPAVATAYATEKGGTLTEFTDGYSYYRVYLNPKGVANKTTIEGNALTFAGYANGAVGPYDVIRNAYYRVTISRIVAPGNSTPEPVIPNDPVSIPTDIIAHIDIVAWDVVPQDEELTPM